MCQVILRCSYLRNSRTIFMGLKYPQRYTQLELCRWSFVGSYLLVASLLSAVLILSSTDKERWVANLGFDIILCILFLVYCKNTNNHEVCTVG